MYSDKQYLLVYFAQSPLLHQKKYLTTMFFSSSCKTWYCGVGGNLCHFHRLLYSHRGFLLLLYSPLTSDFISGWVPWQKFQSFYCSSFVVVVFTTATFCLLRLAKHLHNISCFRGHCTCLICGNADLSKVCVHYILMVFWWSKPNDLLYKPDSWSLS